MTKWAVCPYCTRERPVLDGAFIKDHNRAVGATRNASWPAAPAPASRWAS